GNIDRGTSSSASNSSSHSRVWMLNSMVREAFVASVTCVWPCVSFQISQLSTVPKANLPASARSLAPLTFFKIQLTLLPEKYASGNNPVLAWIISTWPPLRRPSQNSAVRRSCHTIALYTGSPVSRSHTTVVSRWFVMPIAAMSLSVRFAEASTSDATPLCVDQISVGLCSTQPGLGNICGKGRCASANTLPCASITIALELVVPWSSASMYCCPAICRFPFMLSAVGHPLSLQSSPPRRKCGIRIISALLRFCTDRMLSGQIHQKDRVRLGAKPSRQSSAPGICG